MAPNAYPIFARYQGMSPLEDRLSPAYYIRYFCGSDSTIAQRYTWSPADFGQARLAALGWLSTLAQKQGGAKLEAVVASFRERAEKRPVDLRASWDWLYLCAIRLDHAGEFAAARALSRAAPNDPLALWAYLHSLGGRQTPLGQPFAVSPARVTAPEENILPLDGDELGHVLACYRTLHGRRPELAQAEILQCVGDELKRAGRTDEESRFYREVLAGATQIGQVAGAMNMAAARGDVDGLIDLSRRYDRLQAGRPAQTLATGTFRFVGPYQAIDQGMGVCADRKAYAEVLRLADFCLADIRQKMERQSRGAAARALRARRVALGLVGVRMSTRITMGSTYRFVQMTFPQANEYLDGATIVSLRTAYELYKRDDLLSDLIGHYRRQLAAARSSSEAIYPRLALSSILWWNDEKDEAVAELTRVVEASPPESDLRLDLAELLEQQREPAEALALVDSVQPLDNFSLRRREEVALRVAVTTGNIDRARQAAERLFGLRLDTETQISLSGQMHQLGLHELAEAVLGRARRRAGNKATALVGLMLQYQRQQKLDEAVQVAMQILRSTTANRQAASASILAEDIEAARDSAITVLARSGRLPQLIERANEQLKQTPNAVQVHQALADYYTAARQPARARAELLRIVALRPDDFDLRLRVAGQMLDDGQPDAAIEQYRSVFKKDPSLLGRTSIIQLQNAFRQAGKSAELLQLLEESDLRSIGAPRTITRIIDEVPDDARTNERVVSLFRKAWADFPDGHALLITSVRRDAVWQMSESYDYAREAIIPRSPSPASLMHWYSFLPPISATNAIENGPPAALRLLDLAERRDQLDQLAAEIEAARKTMPEWRVGDVLLALVRCRAGRYDEVKRLVPRALESLKKDPIASNNSYAWYAAWAMGIELENHEATRNLAMAVYEESIIQPYSFIQFRLHTDKAPFRHLVHLYTSEGRREDARHALLGMASGESKFPDSYDDESIKVFRLLTLVAVAPELVGLGYAGDAVPLYAEAIQLVDQNTTISPVYFPNPDQLPGQLRDGLKAALDGLTAAELAPIAARLVSDAIDRRNPETAKDPSKSGKAKARDQAIDLVTLVYPRDLDKARLRSLMAESLAACDARQVAALDEPLETLRKAHPDDLSIATAIALKALASGDAKQIAPALEGLDRLVEQTPLEPLPPGGRANARQRTEAARQLPLWLVARACATQSGGIDLRAASGRLAARAIEAARRTGRPPGPPGHAPRAGRAGPGPRRPEGSRGRLGPDARDGPPRRAGAADGPGRPRTPQPSPVRDRRRPGRPRGPAP